MDNFQQNSSELVENEKKYQTKGFITIFLTQAFSLMGSSVVSFALIWYLTIETESGFILAVGMFVGMVPMLIITPFGGVLSDRINKKILLVVPDALQAVVVVALIYLFYTGQIQIWHILLLLAVRGIAQAFQMPVNMTLPALMLSKDTIPKVNAFNSILNSLIFIVSPAIGAVVLGFMPIGDILWIDVITYLPAQIVLFIGIPKVEKLLNDVKSSFIKDFKEGLSYIKNSGMMPLIVTVAILSIFINPLFNLVPLFIKEVHLGGANELAIIEVGFQLGMFLGSAILLIKKIKPSFKSVNIGIFLLFISTFLISLVPSGQILLLAFIVLIIGITISFIDVQFISLLQIIVPPELQGRVFSSVIAMMKSTVPISVIALGILADLTSIYIVFFSIPLVAILMTIILFFVTGIRTLDKTFSTGKYEKFNPVESLTTA